MHQKQVRFILGLLTILALLMPFNSTSSAQELEKQPLHIVQLGDSYSAGNGAGSYYSPTGCYRSTANWGTQFAKSLADTGLFHVIYQNHACSGGKIENIMNERVIENAVSTDENGICPGPTPNGEVTYRLSTTKTNKCDSIIKAQINYVNDTTDLVLVTMGGNDLRFGSIVYDCYSLMATATKCAADVKFANDQLTPQELQAKLVTMFADIKDKLNPGGKIVYVSYPYLNLDVPYELGGIFSDSYDAGTEIRALGAAGDLAQKAAVDAANAAAIAKGEEAYVVFYDRTKEVFAGHEPDPTASQNDDGWINEFTDENGDGVGIGDQNLFYHPNLKGHTNWASALSPLKSFGAAGGLISKTDIDVAFVVDTTSSMGGEITEVRANIASLVSQLAEQSKTYRVAVVSYRDFPARTGYSGDYPAKVIQTFTDDPALIQTAINSLTLGYGGDWEETVFSGIQAANDLEWRPGVTKIAIVIGDAPALSPEPSPSNLTASQIIANSIAIDPVQVIGVDVGYLNYNGAMGQITAGTGGSMVSGTSGLTAAISGILDQAAKQPLAWVGEAYVGKIGQPIQFDASGSYDPSGLPITRYEWDFDGDGTFDLETAEPGATYAYDAAFDGFVVLRVTGAGGTALASAPITVNTEGFIPQGGEEPCELDENGFSIVFNEEEGLFLSCTPTNFPTNSGEGNPLDNALANLKNAIDGLSPIAFKNIYLVIEKEIEGDNPASACGSLQGMSGLAEAQKGKKITQEQAAAVLKAVDALNNILVCSK